MSSTGGGLHVVVIGAGFYGASIALDRRLRGHRVTLLDEAAELCGKASYGNQARVHQGYHYPRNIQTGLSCVANFPRFVDRYREAIVDGFEKLYAIARRNSQVTASQFESFCKSVGAPVRPAPAAARRLFEHDLIEDVFEVQEVVFDAVLLRRRLERDLAESGVSPLLRTKVTRLGPSADGRLSVVTTATTPLIADQVFICTYSRINTILRDSGLPPVPMKHEVAEVALVRPCPEMVGRGVTVMDGPFFSTIPFPAEGLHSFTHVRYTPHEAWFDEADRRDPYAHLAANPPVSRFPLMARDATRYMPCLQKTQYVRSLFETKTVLIENEANDGRPILFRPDHGLPGVTLVLGGKIDNIDDILKKVGEGDPS